MSVKNCCHLCGGTLNRGYCPACGFYANRKDRIHYRLNESNASRRLDARYGKKLEKQLERREKSHQKLHNDFKGTSTEVIKARREADARKKAIQQELASRGLQATLSSGSMAKAAKETVQSARSVMSTLATELDQKLLSSDGKTNGQNVAGGNQGSYQTPSTARNQGGYQMSSTARSRSGFGTARSNTWDMGTAKGGSWGTNVRPQNTMESKVAGKGFLVAIVAIAFVAAAVFALIGTTQLPNMWDDHGGTPEPEPALYLSYPDEETNTLSETGDDFEALLTGGKYVVGVHIPEGLYKITLVEGDGSLDVTDDVNNISIYEWFELDEKGEETDEDEEYYHITELDEVRLFDGAHITVYPGVVLSFETHNGQTAQMSVLENPLMDVFHVPKGTTLVCGVDFEPGVYDVQGFSNNGLLTYSHPYYWLDDGEFYDEFLWLDEGMTYQNLVLLEGAEISSDDANFTLVPSPEVGNIDYDTYYDYE